MKTEFRRKKKSLRFNHLTAHYGEGGDPQKSTGLYLGTQLPIVGESAFPPLIKSTRSSGKKEVDVK